MNVAKEYSIEINHQKLLKLMIQNKSNNNQRLLRSKLQLNGLTLGLAKCKRKILLLLKLKLILTRTWLRINHDKVL